MGFREGVASAVKGKFCEFADKTEPFARWLYEKTRPIQPGSSASFWDIDNQLPGLASLICDLPEPPEYPPRTSSPFTGGQCPVPYRVELTYEQFGADGESDGVFTAEATELNRGNGPIYGPVGYPFVVDYSEFESGISFRANTASGQTVTSSFFRAAGINTYSILNWVVTRVDGLPDDCGNPDEVPLPPFSGDDNKYDVDISFDDGSGVTVNVPADLTFAFPIFNVNGDLSVPFNIENLNLNLNGEFNLSTGDISFNFGGGNSDNEKCCLGERTEDEPPESEDDPPPEEEEERDIIIGAIVTCQFDENEVRAQVYGQGEGPVLYHSRLGNIYFVVEVSGRRIWTPAQTIQHRQVYIPCPAGFAAVEVKGYFRKGVTFEITPVYRKISETEFPST